MRQDQRRAEIIQFLKNLNLPERVMVLEWLSKDSVIAGHAPELTRMVTNIQDFIRKLETDLLASEPEPPAKKFRR